MESYFASVALTLALCALPGLAPVRAASFVNPIVAASAGTGSADPSVVLHRGYYYYCRAIGNDAIGVARARRLQDIGAAPMIAVYRPPQASRHSRELWAPELQRIRGRWYIYFAASDGVNANHRMYALQASGDDPQGAYAFKGRVAAPPDTWAIDGVALQWGRKLYFVWSGWPSSQGDFPQVLYIAAMRNPWTIAGSRHPIAAPDLPWERAGAPLLEAPQPLRGRGRWHIAYSAGASWGDDSALGLLSHVGGDPLKSSSWRKSPVPVFAKSAVSRAYSVGHVSFVRSPDGRQDWILYHAAEQPGAGWSKRAVRTQPFGWTADGSPEFGTPMPIWCAIDEPSGTPALPRAPSRQDHSLSLCPSVPAHAALSSAPQL